MKNKEQVKPKIAKFWLDLLAGKKIVAIDNLKGCTIGYLKKNPIKKSEKHEPKKIIRNGRFEHAHTNNHSKGESKARRLMAKNSRRINMGKQDK